MTSKELKKQWLIWTNYYLELNDWKDYLDEEFPDVENEYDKWQLVHEENDCYLEDERANLNIQLPNEIIVFGSIGRWDGTAKGYKVIKSGNIKDCLYDGCCDYTTWYCDRYNLKFEGYHHDGCNRYLYRVFREWVTEEQKERFFDAIYFGKCNDRMIRRYTESLRPYIASIYGWNGEKKNLVYRNDTYYVA